jgi:hypothetical protein
VLDLTAACCRASKAYEGRVTTDVCAQIASGLLTAVESKRLDVDVRQLAEALMSPTCRLRRLE